ncbi:MAG: hypothetical protein KAY32_09550 [Candidatus Eisenbacteria sp.]|nr:hypothetical protein [Candidatus Eisenbacteria bacterium]
MSAMIGTSRWGSAAARGALLLVILVLLLPCLPVPAAADQLTLAGEMIAGPYGGMGWGIAGGWEHPLNERWSLNARGCILLNGPGDVFLSSGPQFVFLRKRRWSLETSLSLHLAVFSGSIYHRPSPGAGLGLGFHWQPFSIRRVELAAGADFAALRLSHDYLHRWQGVVFTSLGVSYCL